MTLADLRAAVELADQRVDAAETNPDGTVAEYTLSATDWNRVVAIARGSKSEAAERAIAPFREPNLAAEPVPLTLDALTEALALVTGPGNGTWTRSRPIEEWQRLYHLFADALAALARPEPSAREDRGCPCTEDAELGAGSVCPSCGHRDHGRSGCAG